MHIDTTQPLAQAAQGIHSAIVTLRAAMDSGNFAAAEAALAQLALAGARVEQARAALGDEPLVIGATVDGWASAAGV